jgi:sulfite reductase (NADPH) hemoprotein beta-component
MSETLQAVTANRLTDGAVVYLLANETWSSALEHAALAGSEEAAQRLLSFAAAASERAIVVNPYLIAVSVEADGVHPTSLRERIRRAGPSASVLSAAANASR